MLGNLLALTVTAASEQERAQVAELSARVREATGGSVEVAWVDQGYTGDTPADEAAACGIELRVVRHDGAKKGFVLLPRRWVVERTFAWLGHSRRSARDYARLPPRRPAGTGSPSLGSCSAGSSSEVHNRL